jgi:hypothetical protein
MSMKTLFVRSGLVAVTLLASWSVQAQTPDALQVRSWAAACA